MPGLLRRAGHVLCWQHERGRPHLPTDLHRHLFESDVCQTGACPWARQSRDPRDRKTPVTAADLLNDRVVAFFDEKEVKLSRVLTDRGTEYCGNPEHHEYELYLAVEDIDHSRTKTKSPQTNGIAERFHKTVLDEFYRIAFRKRLYASIGDLQDDLDLWVKSYNEERPHQGRWCFGKTPLQTFLDAIPIAREKMIAA
jgi:transposase InsO family protein